MPIKNLQDVRRLPRLGYIRLGYKMPAKGDKKEYPKEAGYFIIDPKATGAEEQADVFKALYGEKPTAIDIMFPVENTEHFFPQYYKMYKRYGDASILVCKGDGEAALRRAENGDGMVEVECKGEDCEDYICKNCRRLASLQVMLPKLPGIGVWQINTTSRNSIINLNSAVDETNGYIRSLCGGRVAMIPLTLELIEQITQRMEGQGPKAAKHYIMQINAQNVTLEQIQRAALIPASRVALPKADENVDELLYAEHYEDSLPALTAPLEKAPQPPENTEQPQEKAEPAPAKVPATPQEQGKEPTPIERKIAAFRKQLNNDKEYFKILGGDFGVENANELTPEQQAEFATKLAKLVVSRNKNGKGQNNDTLFNC